LDFGFKKINEIASGGRKTKSPLPFLIQNQLEQRAICFSGHRGGANPIEQRRRGVLAREGRSGALDLPGPKGCLGAGPRGRLDALTEGAAQALGGMSRALGGAGGLGGRWEPQAMG
jgi:hypothetical protein